MNIKININKEPENKIDFPESDILKEETKEIKNEDKEKEQEENLLKEVNNINNKNTKKIKKQKIQKKKKKKKGKKDKEIKVEISDLDKYIESEYKKLKFKKTAVLAGMIVTMLALIFFGTYNTFLKKEKDIYQLAAELNSINRTTAFPTEGIPGFLDENIETLIGKKVGYLKGTNKFLVDSNNVFITRINKRSSSIANVYFDAVVETNQNSIKHNFILPIYYDWVTNSYHPAGDVSLRIGDNKNSLEIMKNDQTSFGNYPKLPEEDLNSARVFMTNFFVIVYNTKGDYSQFYTGQSILGDENVTFENINSILIYQGSNRSGYNGVVEYIVSTTEGLSYIVTSYINITKTDKSWIINAIL